jgi:hypothetical protein
MRLHNLFSLPYLPTRRIRGKEPLGNYFQSHVVTSTMSKHYKEKNHGQGSCRGN